MNRSIVILITFLLMIANVCTATTIRVPTDQATIQEAINVASEGDTILVEDGTYTGANNRDLTTGGTNLVIMSENGPSVTTIDCEDQSPAFWFNSGETSASVVDGFTIHDGYATGATSNGGGLVIINSSPAIKNCIFSSCSARNGNGGGVASVGTSAASITDCTFFGCDAKYGGSGVHSNNASTTITGSTFYSNSVTDATDRGGVIHFMGGSGTVTGCTLAKNSTNASAAGVYVDATVTIENTILFENTGGAAVICCCGWSPTITHCLVLWNGPADAGGDDLCGSGVGDILNDHPLFCDYAGDDYSICPNSPCLPANNDWSVQIGAFGDGSCDCATATEAASWGSVKELYR